MKTIRVPEPNRLEIHEVPIPALTGEDQVLIRVRAAGICGSDISIYHGTSPVATYPRIIGHEFAGEVVGLGAAVTGLSEGDHVVVNPVCNCGECRACRKGRGNVCANLEVIGVHRDGGYREYMAVPARNVHPISAAIPWDHAAIVEPYTVAAQVAARGGVEAGDTVFLCGCGQIALTILQVCNLLGATCMMSDVVEGRLQKAKDFGAAHVINAAEEDPVAAVRAFTGGAGADVSIDAACVGDTLRQAADAARNGGVVVTMGFQEVTVPITGFAVTSRELDIRGSRLNNGRFPQVIEWFEEGLLNPGRIITDHIPFTEVERGFEKLRTDPENTMKVILTF